jgi:hypothetical protein
MAAKRSISSVPSAAEERRFIAKDAGRRRGSIVFTSNSKRSASVRSRIKLTAATRGGVIVYANKNGYLSGERAP